jgi:predicted esterase
MLRNVLRLVLPLLIVSAAWAQKLGTAEYQREVQRGVDLLNDGKNDEGIAVFKKLCEVNPTDSLSAYNVACGLAKKKEIDPAFEWLTRAVDLGFGNQPSGTTVDNITFAAEKDGDLASLRADPRFAELVAKMKAMKKTLEEYVATPAIYVPKALEAAAEMPVLVVLHDTGSTKDAVVAGWWKAVADELGFALIAPSGTVQLGTTPADGMAWFENTNNYVARNAPYEKPVDAALATFAKTKKYDRARVFLAGEGAGGSVANTIAFARPELYKGAVSLNGALIERLVAAKAANAGKSGLQVRVMLFPEAKTEGEAPDLSATTGSLEKRFKEWGVEGSASVVAAPADDAQKTALVVEALKAMQPAPKPVEAGGGK